MEGTASASGQLDRAFAPLVGAARTFLAREGRSRHLIVTHVRPAPHDLIVDMHCGGGHLARQIAAHEPAARVVGVSADAAIVARARARTHGQRATLRFAHAAPEDIVHHVGAGTATKVIVTLTDIHSLAEKSRRLNAAREIIDPLGTLFTLDHGARRNARHARADLASLPNAVTPLLRNAGFVAIEEAAIWSTAFGAVLLHRARAS